MTQLPILYSFRRCPYAMRARMALLLGGKTVRVREIILREKPAEMLEASPKGTVPVLVLPDGQVIDESLEVMDWALGGDVSQASEDVQALISRNDGPFKHHLDRYKYATRYEDVDETAHRDAGAAILTDYNERLTRDDYLGGAAPGLADFAVFPFVRQFRIADPDWFDAQDWPALKAWLNEMMGAAIFTAIMPKWPLWLKTGEEPILGPALLSKNA